MDPPPCAPLPPPPAPLPRSALVPDGSATPRAPTCSSSSPRPRAPTLATSSSSTMPHDPTPMPTPPLLRCRGPPLGCECWGAAATTGRGTPAAGPRAATADPSWGRPDAGARDLDARTSTALILTTSHNGTSHPSPSTNLLLPVCNSYPEVGSTVLLMTSNYPNYSALLSSSPKAQAGKGILQSAYQSSYYSRGAISRPMTSYRTIGDAHAKGVAIAWPSICVEMING